MVLAILLAVAFVGVRLFGLDVYTVLSGSMEPNLPVGSLIYVQDKNPADLKAGDVITYMVSEETVVTHRIIEVVPDENDPSILRFRTKGDANNTEDGGLVHSNNILGKQVFHIPLLGYVSNYIQSPPGMYVAIGVGAAILLLTFVPDFFPSKKKEEEEKEEEAPKDYPPGTFDL